MPYPKPNYTQTPNRLFDEHLPDMGLAELKIVMIIVRNTFGWHKEKDKLSLSQLETLTGLSRPSVISGIKSAEERGIIEREKADDSFVYGLVVKNFDHPGKKTLPVGSKETLPTKERVKERVFKTPPSGEKNKNSGKDEKPPKPPTQYQTAMSHLEKLFAQERGCQLPDWGYNTSDEKEKRKLARAANATWRTPLKEIWELCDKDLKKSSFIVRKTVKHFRDNNLVLTKPIQMLEVARSLIIDLNNQKSKKVAGKVHL